MDVLFVCNGNVARSQEAALYFNTLKSKTDTKAMSAGINPVIGKPIDPLVVQVLAEDGISMDGCYRKPLTREMVRTANQIVSFVRLERLPEFARAHTTLVFWDVPDPRHQDSDFHHRVRNDIKKRVIGLLCDIEQ